MLIKILFNIAYFVHFSRFFLEQLPKEETRAELRRKVNENIKTHMKVKKMWGHHEEVNRESTKILKCDTGVEESLHDIKSEVINERKN